MKIVRTASGKRTLKISKKEWEALGKQSGWTKEAADPVSTQYDQQKSEFPAKLVHAFNPNVAGADPNSGHTVQLQVQIGPDQHNVNLNEGTNSIGWKGLMKSLQEAYKHKLYERRLNPPEPDTSGRDMLDDFVEEGMYGKSASGKKTVKISRKQWEALGKQAGWGDEDYDSGIIDDLGSGLIDPDELIGGLGGEVDPLDDGGEDKKLLKDLEKFDDPSDPELDEMFDVPAGEGSDLVDLDEEADAEEARIRRERAKAKAKRDKEFERRKKQVYDKDPIA
jgi:hypothetical protein